MADYFQSWDDVTVGATVYIEWPMSALMDARDILLEPFKVTATSSNSASIENASRGQVVITNLRALRRCS